MNEDEFDEMIQIVESDQGAKTFVDSLEAFYREMQIDINNESRKLDGINIANEDDYFHIEYEQEGGVVGTEYVRDAIIDEEGRLKARTASTRPVVLRDIFEVISEDIHIISNIHIQLVMAIEDNDEDEGDVIIAAMPEEEKIALIEQIQSELKKRHESSSSGE